MAEYQIKYFTAGLGGLVGNGMDLFGQNVDSFRIGEAAGFTPTDNELDARGPITFNGGRENVKVYYSKDDSAVSIGMIIPEQYDEIKIGNVMIFFRYGGKIVPFAMIVFPEPIIKQNATMDIFEQPYPYPGTRLVINLTTKLVDLEQSGGNVLIEIKPVDAMNLPIYGDETQIPIGDGNPWSQFILNQFSQLGASPTLVTKADNGQHWASPLFQDIDNPKYGIIDGGADQGERAHYIWGGRYETDDQLYSDTHIGGAGYEDEGEVVIIGGGTY